MLPKELNIFFNALLYYSRIKVPKSVVCNDENLMRAFAYFPLVGAVVGLIGAAVFMLSSFFLPSNISLLVAIIAMVLSTGALHEDGAADFADGFGGGYTKESVLRIMKDSSTGVYGVIMLILMFGLKYMLICEIAVADICKVFILAHTASRLFPILMVRFSSYARIENSKSQHTKLGVSNGRVCFAAAISLFPLYFMGWMFALVYIAFAIVLFLVVLRYVERRIGGFTGDVLGALQQFSELLFYLLVVVI